MRGCRVRSSMRPMVLAGVVMGAGITPEALAAVVAYPVSIGLLVAAIVVVTFACAQFLMRVHGWRRDDAILASLPGALTAVLAVLRIAQCRCHAGSRWSSPSVS